MKGTHPKKTCKHEWKEMKKIYYSEIDALERKNMVQLVCIKCKDVKCIYNIL